MSKDVVGMIVFFVCSIRTDDWRRATDQFKGGLGFLEGSEKPCFLLGTQDGFLWTVRDVIGTAIVATFENPQLQIFSPKDRLITLRLARKLFFIEELDAIGKRYRSVGFSWPAVVV